MEACSLCASELGPILAESDHWRLVLNRNQNLLGKCFLVLNRHLEVVTELTPTEWMELHQQMQRVTRLLTVAFQPDHFNYAFLQNQDRHVHLHVIPRYAGPRVFAGTTFVDPDYPSHYAVPAPPYHLATAHFSQLSKRFRQLLRTRV